jgi:hypothetical protein
VTSNQSTGTDPCRECDGPVAGFFNPNTGEEHEPGEVRFLLHTDGRSRWSGWIEQSGEAAYRETAARHEIAILGSQSRDSDAIPLCARHRDELTRIPTAEDWRDVRTDLAFDWSR